LPQPQPAPLVRIRAAQPGDIAALCRLETAVFPGDRIAPASFRRLLSRPSAELRVATAGGDLLGYALLLFRKGTSVARLYSIAVAAEARGRGVGRRLMEDAARIARARGSLSLRLEVRRDNSAAIGLYEGLGYRVFGRHAGYYDDGMDALRMECRL
jgi:ribosomal protein S18 acetylase RimI-like enzyme